MLSPKSDAAQTPSRLEDMANRVFVVGSVNMDVTLDVTTLPHPGETVLASALTYAPGGKGGNQAVAAARAGARVELAGAVGDDEAGGRLLAHLRAEGVGFNHVVRRPGPSGTAVIVVETSGENIIVVAPGANSQLTVPRVALADCDVLLTQLEIPVEIAVAAAHEARNAGAIVILNASPAVQGSTAELASVADVVVVNEHESSQWIGTPAHLVVTLWARGARYTGPDGEVEVPAPSVAAVDTTGAGDVFAGVLAAHWPGHAGSADERLRAVRRACAAGALATLVRGAGNCAPGAEAIERAVLL